jgi:heat shock protein HslJ
MRRFAAYVLYGFFIFSGCSSKKHFAGEQSYHDTDSFGRSALETEDTTHGCQMTLAENQQLFLKGIDFFAFGNQPSWKLELDMDNAFRFSEHEGYLINTPAVKGHKAMDTNVEFFHAITESAEIRITISDENPHSKGSEILTSYNVRIEAKYSAEKNFQTFEGCGFYPYDYRLQDIWILESMNTVNPDAEKLLKGLPVFEFYPSSQRASGHTGCNSFNSRIEVRGNQITFGPIISTKMSCPGIAIEQAIINRINQKAFRYRINDGKLTLDNANGDTITFRKID